MAFDVTPTSGAAPYTLSASFTNANNIDGVTYVASVAFDVLTGVCPAQGSGTPLNPVQVASLVKDGTLLLGISTVPTGSCRTYTLRITRVDDGVVIASSSVNINNV